MEDLYRLWVKQAYTKALREANDSRDALVGLTPDGPYADAISRMSKLHYAAAAVYKQALDELQAVQP